MVQLAALVLAQAVEGLVGGRIEAHAGGESRLALHFRGRERHAGAAQELISRRVQETDGAVRQADGGRERGGADAHFPVLLEDLEVAEAGLRDHHEAGPLVQHPVRAGRHADEFRPGHLQAHHGSGARERVGDADNHLSAFDFIGFSRTCGQEECGREQ